MYTANTMSSAFEALGMSLPYSSTMANEEGEKVASTKESARVLVEAIKKDLKPRDIVTRKSLENAVSVIMATGGSTNAVLHFLAIAHAAGVEWTIDDFERVRRKTPVLCNLKPSGQYVAVDFHRAGGVRRAGLWSALFCQFVIGAGLGGTYMPGLKSLTDHLQGAAQSRATAFYTAAFGVGSSISIVVSGKIAAAFGWPAAFAFGAIGPVLAALLVILCMPKGRVHAAHESAAAPALLDFRPVLKNRKTRLYVLGYSLHNYELFGQRSWMVAFLVFCGSLQPEGAGLPLAAATLAAMINVLGPVMSVSGNELALHCDIVVASQTARFGMSLAQVGLAPNWFLAKKLMEVLGPVTTREMLLLGDPLPAIKLHALGLIARCVPPDQLEAEAEKVIGRLANNAPLSLKAMKALTVRQLEIRDHIKHDDIDALVVAARAPEDERPAFTATIGLRRPTRRAIRPNRRGFPKLST